MSSRQLRKLQKQRELEQIKEAADQSESDGSAEEPTPPVKSRGSLFAALGGGEDDETSQEDEEEAQQIEEKKQVVGEPQTSMSAKKSKKKKKKKQRAKAAVSDHKRENEGDEDGEDEIDKAIKELKLSGRANENAAQTTTRGADELLGININNLKVLNEMRRLFGQDVIESATAEEEQEQRNRNHRGQAGQQVDLETFLRGPPNQKKLPEVSLRRNVFIQGREHWPRKTAGGLQMKQLENSTDKTEYTYMHDSQYDDAQKTFFKFVGQGDPMRMVWLLFELPYHVSTLLQVSSVAKQDQNMALASELCERALFTFGRVATSAFRQDLEQGRARLDFRRPENRQFWLAGYHYLRSLIRKGTYRTALEWAKVLYALDESDPYAMRYYVFPLAVRAHQAAWLVRLTEKLESTEAHADGKYLKQTVSLALLQMGDEKLAKDKLCEGIKQVPWLYCALFQELGLDAPPSVWGVRIDCPNREFWVKLYIHQTKALWNNTQAINLLREAAKEMPKCDLGSLPQNDPPVDLGATRLAFLEGDTSLIACAPREFLERQPNFEFDPLPPPEEENIFTTEGCRLPWIESSRGTRAMETQMEIQLRNLIDQRLAMAAAAGGNVGVGGALGGDGDDSGDEDEINALDDEELRRDIEEFARRGNSPGILQTLMQMFRGGPQEAAEVGALMAEAAATDGLEQGEFPGAWPEDDIDDIDDIDNEGTQR